MRSLFRLRRPGELRYWISGDHPERSPQWATVRAIRRHPFDVDQRSRL